VNLTLKNISKRAGRSGFRASSGFEIYLRNSTEAILTIWSDNHAFEDKPATVLVTRRSTSIIPPPSPPAISREQVFICEVFLPQFPELRIRQKF